MPGFPKIAKSTILGKNSGGRGSHFWDRAGIPQSLPTRLEESECNCDKGKKGKISITLQPKIGAKLNMDKIASRRGLNLNYR